MALRTLLAAVLGVLLGGFLLAYPEAALRMQLAGRVPRDRGGEYGSDAMDSRLTWLVRAVGAGVLLAGLYFGLVGAGLA